MLKQKFVAGGELTFPPSIIFAKYYGQFSSYGAGLTEYHRYYTFGAYYSSKAVIQNIDFQKDDYVLLPAYLCPTMIYPFKEAGVKYAFYKLKEGLLPDLEDIVRKSGKHLKAILFIDYFGYSYRDYLSEIVSYLRNQRVVIIQDIVQAWIDNEEDIYADYCMNSVRKYSPIEASVLFSRQEMRIETKYMPITRFLLHKRYAQLLRYYHLNYGIFKPESFLRHIAIANESYHLKGIIGMPKMNAWLLDRLNYQSMSRKRIIVFKALSKNLGMKSIVGLELGKSIPLAFPVLVQDRGRKKELLHNLDVHCPIHWLLSEEIDKCEHEFCWELQSHELTIPININLTSIDGYLARLKEVL